MSGCQLGKSMASNLGPPDPAVNEAIGEWLATKGYGSRFVNRMQK